MLVIKWESKQLAVRLQSKTLLVIVELIFPRGSRPDLWGSGLPITCPEGAWTVRTEERNVCCRPVSINEGNRTPKQAALSSHGCLFQVHAENISGLSCKDRNMSLRFKVDRNIKARPSSFFNDTSWKTSGWQYAGLEACSGTVPHWHQTKTECTGMGQTCSTGWRLGLSRMCDMWEANVASLISVGTVVTTRHSQKGPIHTRYWLNNQD